VAMLKGLWKKASDKSKALMAYRATALEHGFSPAQLLMGRQLRTPLPSSQPLKSSNLKDAAGQKQQELQLTFLLSSLAPGQKAWITTEQLPGSVVYHAETPRSYLVQTTRGLLQRNRIHFHSRNRPVTENVPEVQQKTSGSSAEGPEQWYRTRSGRCLKPPQKLDL
uniref:Uncharacterized protein n=1 Tax=Latimeria chalumnae TaxID=7897 RepID=H3B7G5_LATCH